MASTTNRFLDNLLSLKLLRKFTQRYQDTEMFKLGIIDSSGKFLIPPSKQTIAQKNSYTKLDVLVINLRKLIEKLPFGKRSIAKYAIALKLIQEEIGQDYPSLKDDLSKYIKENCFFEENCGVEMTDMLFEDGMGSGGAVSNVTGGMDMADSVLGKRKKITSTVEYKPDDEHNGAAVFDVSDANLMKSRFGKNRYLKYSSYIGADETGQKIKEYSKANPKKNIILRNKGSQNMMYFRRRPN